MATELSLALCTASAWMTAGLDAPGAIEFPISSQDQIQNMVKTSFDKQRKPQHSVLVTVRHCEAPNLALSSPPHAPHSCVSMLLLRGHGHIKQGWHSGHSLDPCQWCRDLRVPVCVQLPREDREGECQEGAVMGAENP